MPTHSVACHCGRIRFEVDAAIERVTRCNCSIEALSVDAFDGRHWESAFTARENAHGMARRD